VLKIARQPFYRWVANPVTDADAELTAAYRANALLMLIATAPSSATGSG
jgi:hypothetical protein